MNFVKRAYLAIIRRKTKTIILFSLFFLIANLVLSGFAIGSATKQAGILARQKLGGEITLSFNRESAMQKQFSENANSGTTERRQISVTTEPITQEMVDKILSVSHITAHNITINTTAYASGFTPVVANEAQTTDTTTNTNTTVRETPNQMFIMGGGPGGSAGSNGTSITRSTETTTSVTNSKIEMPDVVINGVTDMNLINTFKDGTNSLIDGEYIITSTETENIAVIEEQLATSNNINVGDTIKIKGTADGDDIELLIVGIYKTGETSSEMNFNISFSQPYNRIYVKNDTALSIKEVVGTNTSSGIRMDSSSRNR